uniref:Uncharacterized protein n=1 Tax=Panagrolaimus sp. PS1159 TaxID=55785 RepID=A0AC35G0S7_9BILA
MLLSISISIIVSSFLISLFVARRGYTAQGKECLIYRSVRDPNVGYEFIRKSRGGNARRTAYGDIDYVCGGRVLAQQLLRNQRAQNIPSVRQIGFGDNEFAFRLEVDGNIPMDDLKKYAEHQAFNTTPDYDDEAVNQAIQMHLPIIPPFRPRIQQNPPIRPQLQNQNIYLYFYCLYFFIILL